MKSESRISATGIILAGGKSKRFGRDKSLEPVGGRRLIEIVLEKLQALFPRLIIVSNEPRKYAYLKIKVVRDLVPGLGPIGGLYTGLHVLEDSWGFFAACDMPYINSGLVQEMARLRTGFDAVVPKVGDKFEPLHAYYSRRCLEPVGRFIDSGGHQIIQLFDDLRVRYIEEREIRVYDPGLKSFFNINWPEDVTIIPGQEQ